jgi:hypothetical protein
VVRVSDSQRSVRRNGAMSDPLRVAVPESTLYDLMEAAHAS